MNRIKCIVSYDGSKFHGFQVQNQFRTVQGEIQKAIKNICKDEIERNIKRFQDCIDARTKINNECFNGGDNAHNDEIERALAGKKRCQDKLNQLL